MENTEQNIEPSMLSRPHTIDILRYEIKCINNNKWMDKEDKDRNIAKIKQLIIKENEKLENSNASARCGTARI